MIAWRLAAASVAVVMSAGLAQADTKTLAEAGDWEAFGGTTPQGRGVCGISAEIAKRYFSVKFYAGNDTFTVQLGTDEWKATEDRKQIGVRLRFDANPIWRATAVSFHFEDDAGGLQFHIKREELDNFAREFRDSNFMTIDFDAGLQPWSMGLKGTSAVNGAFQTCVRNLK